jgi:hypothetical protein
MSAAEDHLTKAFDRVKGASSKIAARVAVALLQAQSANGLRGGIAEIGVFEGRFFIPLALCCAPGESVSATDVFTWPDEGIAERFEQNCRAHGVAMDRLILQKTSTQDLTPAAYRASVGAPLRFLHIDGGHTYDAVTHDLRLAKAALSHHGVLCLDDVLHPRYPALTVAVTDWLKANPDFSLFAVSDRESFASSCKFFVSRREHAPFYRDALQAALPEHVMKFRAPYFGDEALILSPAPA